MDGLESARSPGSPGERVQATNFPLAASAHFSYQEPPAGEEQEERIVCARTKRRRRRGEKRRSDTRNKKEFCSAAVVDPAADRRRESSVATCRPAGEGGQEKQSARHRVLMFRGGCKNVSSAVGRDVRLKGLCIYSVNNGFYNFNSEISSCLVIVDRI